VDDQQPALLQAYQDEVMKASGDVGLCECSAAPGAGADQRAAVWHLKRCNRAARQRCPTTQHAIVDLRALHPFDLAVSNAPNVLS
jgi:hypothetical protein